MKGDRSARASDVGGGVCRIPYRGKLLSGLGLPALFIVSFWEVWKGLCVLRDGSGFILISASLSFGTRTCKLKLVISIASSNGWRPHR